MARRSIGVLRPSLVVATVAAIVIVAGSELLVSIGYRFPWVLNLTPSLPGGLYETVPCVAGDSDQLVQFAPPEPFKDTYRERGYLVEPMELIKPRGILAGAKVCWEAGMLEVNGRGVTVVQDRDAVGRPLATHSGCERIPNGHVLPLQSDLPRSLDGRYFGPIPEADITACLRPVWVADANR